MRLFSTLSGGILKISSGRGSNTGEVVPVNDHYHCKKFLSYTEMKPLLVQLLLEHCDDVPSKPSFLQGRRDLTPSVFPCCAGFPALWSPSWSSFGPSPVRLPLSGTVGTRTEHSTPGAARQALRGLEWSRLCLCQSQPCRCSPGSDVPWLLQRHTADSCSACAHQQPQGSLSQAAPQPHFIKLHTVLAWPLFQPGQVPVWDGSPFWHVHLNHPVWCHQQIWGSCFQPHHPDCLWRCRIAWGPVFIPG